MFKCTGICSECGKCKSQNMLKEADDRKTKILHYPADFSPDTRKTGYGVAFDIGTTTVVGMLWDLKQGRQTQVYAMTNTQNQYGLDVISRITFCNENDDNLNLLRKVILQCLNEIIQTLAARQSIQSNDIAKVVICGNTTMAHLVAGYHPGSLAEAPYTPSFEGILAYQNNVFGLDICDTGRIVILPGIAGHVGGDITAGLVASRLFERSDTALFIDIGTNGELVLNDRGSIYTCSTAAGPAFEGAAITHGMRASKGAIEAVEMVGGDVYFKTIGNCQPTGICGSGLIDAISEMLDAKLINSKGKLLSEQEAVDAGAHKGLAARLVSADNQRQFVLVYIENGQDIVITQKDIREIQLAKAAIEAGVVLLLRQTGKRIDQIDQILIAGAFGNYINIDSGLRIGLLPAVARSKLIPAGNTAGAGVAMTLASDREMKQAESIPKKVHHVDLASCQDFQKVYLKAMSFH